MSIVMFTGLIQSIGRINRRADYVFIDGCEPFSPLQLGDSVSVDGVCLTVAELYKGGFLANVSEETLKRTTLGMKAEKGAFVNLEPALRLADRLGGHLVSGHIDDLGQIVSIEKLSKSWRLEVCWKNSDFGKYVCEKGSIAIDGISLTVGGCSEQGSSLWLAIVPHTWESTSLSYMNVGELVNLEADLMAKYAESLLEKIFSKQLFDQANIPPKITSEWLAKNGWMDS